MASRSSNTTGDGEGGTEEFLDLATPGELLLEEFLKPLGVSQYRLAHAIGVSPWLINEIVHGKRAITADTALRLGTYFGMSARFWMNLQSDYELRRAEREGGGEIAKRVAARVG